MPDANIIGSVEKAAALLMLFCKSGAAEELSIHEMATLLQVPKTTAHRLASTLVRSHLLEQNPETKKYLLGFSNRLLGDRYMASHKLERIIPRHLKELVQMLGESVSAAVLDKHETVIYEKLEGTHALRATTQIGSRNPLHCTGSGKVYLSYMPVYERRELIEQLLPLRPYTPYTITDPDKLMENLEAMRARGYAYDEEEIHRGQTCISAPVFDRDGQVCTAITVSGPKERIDRKGVETIGTQLRDYCLSISRSLGYVSHTEEDSAWQ